MYYREKSNYISLNSLVNTYLTDGIKENENEVHQIPKPKHGLIDVKWVVHVPIN